MDRKRLIVYLVDDEPLALKRLTRMLRETQRVEIAGSTTNPQSALEYLSKNPVDVLFLDIQMPELTGFELLAQLTVEPAIIFTTAYDEYALNAFQVNSVDYLLKPIEARHLDRALSKLERLRGTSQAILEREQMRALAVELAEGLRASTPRFPHRIASRYGEKVVFIDLNEITHFYAKDKLIFGSTDSKDYPIDSTITELEQRLDPARFVRIHRSILVNVGYIQELHAGFGGGMIVRLRDRRRTELQVTRDRARELKAKMLSS
jgi:two-component system LytT family response regulator